MSEGCLAQATEISARRIEGAMLFSLRNSQASLSLKAHAGDLLLVSLRSQAADSEWAIGQSVFPHWHVTPSVGHLRFRGHRVKSLGHNSAQMELCWESAAGVVIRQTWTIRADSAVFRVDTSILNGSQSPMAIEESLPLDMEIRFGEQGDLYWLRGHSYQMEDDPSGQRYGIFTLGRTLLSKGAELFSGPRSSKAYVPWFLLHDPEKSGGVVGGLVWSGQWRIAFQRVDSSAVRVSGGPTGSVVEVLPGTQYVAPAFYICPFAGEPEEGRNSFTDYLQRYAMPTLPDDFPWVQYSTWYGHYISFTEERLQRDLQVAADLGLELFEIDAGWYRGSTSEEGFGKFSRGLGDWRESREKFPGGLAAFGENVRRHGLKFGLWVEPERVDISTERTGHWKSDWLAWRDGKPIGSFYADACQLCLGSPGARRWAKRWLSRLVREYKLDWMLLDSNMWGVCTRADHGHARGEGEKAQVEGLYRVLRDMSERFPSLVVENCAAGGHRMDYGLLGFTQIGFLCDDTWPSVRVRHHAAGAAWAFPLAYLDSWMVDSADEPIGPATSDVELRYMLRSRMLGAFGLSAQISEWPERVRAIAQQEIALYKRLRPLIQANRLYFVLPQSDLRRHDGIRPRDSWEDYVGVDLVPEDPWEAYELLSRTREQGAVLVFRHGGESSQQVLRLKGIDGHSRYRIWDEERQTERIATGQELMGQGVEVELQEPKAAAVLWLEKAQAMV